MSLQTKRKILKLSDHFSLRELTKSQTGTRLGISNEPDSEHLVNLVALCHNVLEPIRKEFGVVTVTSCYRSPALNKAIGSTSEKSQHIFGEACDLECFRAKSNLFVAEWVKTSLDFDQIILEYYNDGDPFSGWIHISSKRLQSQNRNMCLHTVINDGRTSYQEGLT